jgi:hypothetical protein
MKNDKRKPKEEPKLKTYPLNIRFSKKEHDVIKTLAEEKGKKFATFVRESCFAHIHNLTEHDKLLADLKVENPEAVQETIFDIINKSNEAVLKSLENIHLDVLNKLKLLEKLQRKNIYLQFYLSRETPQEDHAQQAQSATRRTNEYLEEIDNGSN